MSSTVIADLEAVLFFGGAAAVALCIAYGIAYAVTTILYFAIKHKCSVPMPLVNDAVPAQTENAGKQNFMPTEEERLISDAFLRYLEKLDT